MSSSSDMPVERALDDVEPVLNDHVIRWGRAAVAGWLDANNIRLLNHCMRRLPTKDPILEIGAFCGASTIALARMRTLAKRENAIISVDPWRFEDVDFTKSIGDSDVSFADYRVLVKTNFLTAIKTFAPARPPFHFEEYSDDFFVKWNARRYATDSLGRSFILGGPISLAYIDGDHRYDAAKRDFENCHKHLVPGGFIVFDDSADGTQWGSHKVAVEVLERDDYELLFKGPNYCFRKRG